MSCGGVMARAGRRVALMAAALILLCVACRLAMHNAYIAYMPIPLSMRDIAPEALRIVEETPGIVSSGVPERVGDRIRVAIRPRQPGATWLDFNDASGENLGISQFRVGRFGTIYDTSTGGFTGDSVVLGAVTAFFLGTAAIMFHACRRVKGPAFYAYATIHAVGFGLFALLTGLFMLGVSLRHALHPESYAMCSAYDAISGAGYRFMIVTAPMMLAFAAAMAVSNVALLRHEGFAPKNVLGIGVALALVGGEALAFWLFGRNFSGSEMEWRVHNTLQNVYATGFAYFECMLFGAVVCGLKAARHSPAPDADVILILGCRFRADGTLTPLLRGRVDRAVAFWREQKAATGRDAVLMPSGGQGPDECMAEAEAMRRYLRAQGVPEASIRVEDRSRNTFENMARSREIIEREKPGAKVVYATTNYHVFRSGVWAARAGLRAEGMGSRTRWWYWPNAFMRECAGLLLNRVPQELLLLVAMIAFFGALSMALG